MASLGGGIASTGGPCGALTGGVALIGRLFGKVDPEAKDDPRMWKAAFKFYKRFQNEICGEEGSVDCRDIACVDWRNREASAGFYGGEGRLVCGGNTGRAAGILGEVIDRYLEE